MVDKKYYFSIVFIELTIFGYLEQYNYELQGTI